MKKFGVEVPRSFTVVEAVDSEEALFVAHDDMFNFIKVNSVVTEIKDSKSSFYERANRLVALSDSVKRIFNSTSVYFGPEDAKVYFSSSLCEDLNLNVKGLDEGGYVSLASYFSKSAETDKDTENESEDVASIL